MVRESGDSGRAGSKNGSERRARGSWTRSVRLLVDEDDGFAVDDGLVPVCDLGGQAELLVPQILDDLTLGGDAVADADRVVELQILREIDHEPGEAGERGADEAADEGAVGDTPA